MPPNDPMFDLPTDTKPDDTPTADTTKPEPGVSADALREALSGITAPFAAERETQQRTIDDMTQQIAELRSQVSQTETPAAGDFSEEFFADPEGLIKKTAQSVVDERIMLLGPAIDGLANLGGTALYDRMMQDIDTEFGAGAWAEDFAPIIDQRIADERKTNPMVTTNIGWLQREVLAVKGMKMTDLVERQSKNATKSDEDKDAERRKIIDEFVNTTTMHGGVNFTAESRPKEPTQFEQEYLSSLKKSGDDVNLEDLRRNLDCGSSLAEWQASQKSASGEK